jgi:hypothetical protein
LKDVTTLPACGRIVDQSNSHNLIVIACGSDNPTVQLWDAQSNELYLTDYVCPSGLTGNFEELDDSWLVWTNTGDNVHYFNLQDGFVEVTNTPVTSGGGDAWVVPRGYVECTVVPPSDA